MLSTKDYYSFISPLPKTSWPALIWPQPRPAYLFPTDKTTCEIVTRDHGVNTLPPADIMAGFVILWWFVGCLLAIRVGTLIILGRVPHSCEVSGGWWRLSILNEHCGGERCKVIIIIIRILLKSTSGCMDRWSSRCFLKERGVFGIK